MIPNLEVFRIIESTQTRCEDVIVPAHVMIMLDETKCSQQVSSLYSNKI